MGFFPGSTGGRAGSEAGGQPQCSRGKQRLVSSSCLPCTAVQVSLHFEKHGQSSTHVVLQGAYMLDVTVNIYIYIFI